MPKKVWKARAGGLYIHFENTWNFRLQIRETLTVNGAIVSDSRKGHCDSFKDLVTGQHAVVFCDNGMDYHVLVKCGSKWPGIFLGCHIFVNGELIGGDTKCRLMFA